MDLTALLLSRVQFGFTVPFHIIFPSFTIGLAAWLTVLEALHLRTGRPAYRLVFEFCSRSSALRLGSVSSPGSSWRSSSARIGASWLECRDRSRARCSRTRPSAAFFLEASFFGIPAVWSLSRPAVVLFVFDGHGGVGHHALGVLDLGIPTTSRRRRQGSTASLENRRNLFAVTLPPPFGSLIDIFPLRCPKRSWSGSSTAARYKPMRSMMPASAANSRRSAYHAPVAATQIAPVKYEASSICGKRTQITGLKRMSAQSFGTEAPFSMT
jgi:Cytochrome bd terminal oxidase subunit I